MRVQETCISHSQLHQHLFADISSGKSEQKQSHFQKWHCWRM